MKLEAASNPEQQLVFPIVFGVSAAMLSVVFGLWMANEINEVRKLKKKQADIEERYRVVREDMLREMDRRHRTEQTLRSLTSGTIGATVSAGPIVGTYTISSAFPANSNPLSAPAAQSATTRIGEITLAVSDTPRPPAIVVQATPTVDQNHFERIAQPRRFLRLE